MHYLIGLITAVMVLFPASDSGGKSLYQLWMESYEKYLYQQMYDNLSAVSSETQTELSEVEYEQEASEETADKVADVEVGETLGADSDRQREIEAEAVLQPETVETVQEQDTDRRESCETSLVREVTPLYMVDGYVPDESLQTYLYQRLCEYGIGYFFPYAVCLIAQESTWNPIAENRNGLDKGLLQYRISYWPTLEWWNPYAEIDVFVQQMANRANNGKTVSEMISAHNQSDWGPYCQSYVDAVMQHSNTLVQIR